MSGTPADSEYMYSILERVLACDLCHDENGHAYLKVPARSLMDLGTVIGNIVRDETNIKAYRYECD